MKLLFIFWSILIFVFSWTSFNNTKIQVGRRSDISSCGDMGTLNEYQKEASTMAFANMHPAPKYADASQQLGTMMHFNGTDGTQANAYFIPSKKKSNKWLIVIQEWWGLNDNIKNEADKYFKDLDNMNVLAVDLYDGKIANTPDSAMKLMRVTDMNRMTAILKGAIQYAGNNASIYSVGWCFGGMWSLQTAILAGPQGKGTVMFYGRPETDMSKLAAIKCDVIGFFGNLDKSPSPEMVTAFEGNMKTAGKHLETFKYEAGHGFANPSNPSFNASATEDSYKKAIAFLKSH